MYLLFLRPYELFLSFWPIKWQFPQVSSTSPILLQLSDQLTGKTILITGGNSGIGLSTLQNLASHSPSKIYILARNEHTSRHAISELEILYPTVHIGYISYDLSSLASVKSAVKVFKKQSERLDILILNAGVMALPYSLTEPDELEIQLATNYIGHWYLTRELIPSLLTTAELGQDVRIITLTSVGHVLSPPSPLSYLPYSQDSSQQTNLANLTPYERYGLSKLLLILSSRHLSHLHPSITSISLHPGLIHSPLWTPTTQSNPFIKTLITLISTWFMSSSSDGARNTIWAATAKIGDGKGEVKSGGYYMPIGKVVGGSKESRDEALARRVWEWTDEVVGARGF